MTAWPHLYARGMRRLTAACLCFVIPLLSLNPRLLWAEESFAGAVDKCQYTLFHPTPRHLMRELATDRPDKTETAYSVDAGHFQLEMDLHTYTHDRYNAEHREVLTET